MAQTESPPKLDQVQGWGADVRPEDRPGVPRDKNLAVGPDALYPDIVRQKAKHRIHRSTEHGKMPPVFGSSVAPKGLSGLLRNKAYDYSEGRFAHWLMLLAADRVDVVESLLSDLSKGHIPNIFKEMGLGAELKYNRKNFAKKAAIAGIGLIAVAALLSIRRNSRRRLSATR